LFGRRSGTALFYVDPMTASTDSGTSSEGIRMPDPRCGVGGACVILDPGVEKIEKTPGSKHYAYALGFGDWRK